ncbi:MAG: S1-like domain-containing RNA-binding protein [Tissierellaceae bacterium]|nr:S1-like domain-containing RNA-binding protein [Tissierellaceae bacterium]
MINLGELQELEIKRFTSVGAYLNEEIEEEDDVLLPKSQIPNDVKVGDKIEVFVYNDSKDRIIATTRRPKATLGNLAHLMVVDTTKIGSFLDWGLEKDLFLPFSETVGSVEKGKTYLVGVYLDKSDRLCATMKIKDMLRTDSEYKENNLAKGTIYSINKNIGAFVAVDDKYDGLIPKRELFGIYEVGDIIEVRINRVQEDGKLDLSLRDRSYIQMDTDAKIILQKLKENGGSLGLGDKSSPELIKKELNMSKAGFKRAIGRLYKEEMIVISDHKIKLDE